MRLHVAFAVFAITATTSAAGLAMPVSGGIPDVQVVELGDTPLVLVEPLAEPVLVIPASGTRTSEVEAPKVERVDKLPRHLLLPDGALTLSLEPVPDQSVVDGVLVHGAAPVLPAAPERIVEAPKLPILQPSIPPSETETRTASAPAVVPEPAPAPVATAGERVFVPPQPEGGVEPTVIWIGGLAALAGTAAAGLLLYHRIRPNAALENETRKTIFDAVCATPGLGVHEISKLAGVSYSTATYHLERLIGAGMIVMTPDGNKLCYYKNGGAFSESERKILPLLKNDEASKLFEAILVAPGTYRAALAEKLGVTATTINWHLRRLREAGLVDETRMGRSAHLYAKIDAVRPTLLALATKVEPSEPIVAERLRRFAGDATPSGPAGIAGA